VFQLFEEKVPTTARVALAVGENSLLSPYFGSSLSRHVSLVSAGEQVPSDAHWLVLSPSRKVSRCDGAWRRELTLESGWQVELRVRPDNCPAG
jgi:hypothetical protein